MINETKYFQQPTGKVQVGARDLRVLADHAKAAGTERHWMAVALEWIDYADAEIRRYQSLAQGAIASPGASPAVDSASEGGKTLENPD